MWATGDVLIQVPDPVVRWEVKNTRRRLSRGFRCASAIIYLPTHPVRGCVIDTPGATVAGQHPAGLTERRTRHRRGNAAAASSGTWPASSMCSPTSSGARTS